VLVVSALSLIFIFLVNAITFPLLSSQPDLLVIWVALLLPGLVSVGQQRAHEPRTPVRVAGARPTLSR